MDFCDSEKLDNFSPVFKFYKQKKVSPSLKNVIGYPSFNTLNGNIEVFDFQPPCKTSTSLGINKVSPWKVHHINNIPGLYLVTNIFTNSGIKLWSRRCLEVYCKDPNKTNLDSTCSKEEVNEIWDRSLLMINKHHDVSNSSHKEQCDVLKSSPIWKLRWSTLGYHHDWDTKVYNTSAKIDFPSELQELCTILADSIEWKNFKSQAAIVNYYHEGSTLCAHTDHSEHNMEPPVISLSFGLPAVFLIGGETKATRPSAILLPSGSALIMSGASRKAYHAVARILPHNHDSAERILPDDDDDHVQNCDAIDMFLRHTRINLNVRQVF